VIEAANQLIEDRDVDKIPGGKGGALRARAASVAREFAGWFQDKFTPREQTQMDEATAFLEALRDNTALGPDGKPIPGSNDHALDALNSGWFHRWKVGKGMEKPQEGKGLSAPFTEANNMLRQYFATDRNPGEQAFARKIQQAQSVIAGLGMLTRGGTRPTDKQIDSIRQELPSIWSATNAKDAKERINNLLREVAIARRTGTQRRTEEYGNRKGGGQTPPPAAGGTNLSPEAKAYLKSIGRDVSE